MPQSGMAIHELIVDAHHDHLKDRRSESRCPFFRPVSVQTEPGTRFSAFTREISATGIGLLHNFELPLGEVELSIPHRRQHVIRVRTRILWCQDCGEGWFISGGQFIGVARLL
jgi:hypothetical protein